jgi:hypothetical protein
MENIKNETYNGWANYNTWNVALWLQNDEFLNMEAMKFSSKGYLAFVKYMSSMGGDISFKTPDKVAWNDPTLDIKALDRMLRSF